MPVSERSLSKSTSVRMHATAEHRAPQSETDWNRYPQRCARFWHGMRMRSYLKLMFRNRWRVHPMRIGMVLTVAVYATGNSALCRIQQLFYGRKIRNTKVERPPLFIIGRWRSGTTWVHELLAQDERFAYPTTYECFVPHHFLITESWLGRALWFLMPDRRPMDNMEAGFDRPQEDEFALCAMGAPTPYFRMAFPNHPPVFTELLDMEGLDERHQSQFAEALLWFVKALTYREQKQLVLKSPPHTGRVAFLSELFPGAKFIHMVRHPYALFASTRKMWRALEYIQGFQIPKYEHLDEIILSTLTRMYRAFEKQRATLDPSRIIDVRYEDMIRDPLAEMERIYHGLDFGDFSIVRDAMAQYVREREEYSPNQHFLESHVKNEIDRRWEEYMRAYGYD